MIEFLLFIIATIGMTKIIVDSSIFSPIRDFFSPPTKSNEECPKINPFRKWIGNMMMCHQCSGFWCGLICGWKLFYPSFSYGDILLFGFAGSYLSLLSEIIIEFIFSKIEV